jgi:hypothetical protein
MSTNTEALATLPMFTVDLTESEKSVLIEIGKLLGLENSTKYLSILQLMRLFFLVKRIPAFNIMGYTFLSSLQELKVLMYLGS